MTGKPLRKSSVDTLRGFALHHGLGTVTDLETELQDMMDVLLGRVPPPINRGTMTLMEVADAYHARAREIQVLIYRAEAHGTVKRGDPYYRFRTGQLTAFIELVKSTAALGSRRLTMVQVRQKAELTGRD